MAETDRQQTLSALLDKPGMLGRHSSAPQDALRSALLSGSLDLDRAFQQGQLHPPDLNTVRALLDLHESAPVPVMPSRSRSWPIGKTYDGGCLLVRQEDFGAFALAIDEQGSWAWGPDAVAPPMFHARAIRDLLFAVMQDEDLSLDFARLLHASHDVSFHKLVAPGDLLHMRGRLQHVDETPTGVRVCAHYQVYSAGSLISQADSVFFVPRASSQARPRPPAPALPAPSRVVPIQVGADQSYRYADASLDRNPLHVDPQAAQAAGQDDVIVQGLCTLALAGRAVLVGRAPQRGGIDGRQLRRLAGRWTRPVHNGQLLSLRAWDNNLGARFIVVNESGHTVIANGIAEFEEST